MVNVASCNLKSTTTIEDGERLRVRGRDDLEHPELMRGGSAFCERINLTGANPKKCIVNLENVPDQQNLKTVIII